MTTNQRIRVGVIGAGRIGRLHMEHLKHRIPDAELVAVADVVESAADEAARTFDIPASLTDYRKILDDVSVHAVLICSATDTHAQIIREAAQSGKHIFCEKPIALELDKIEQALT
ncbi:Gfo/Idh/MocA family oxidoreductase, partial [bacterium]|nr:Gfo/Idh/MocA family oxidoreductase [bacterium]